MGNIRSTFKHAAVYSAASMAGKLIGFILLPFYAHRFQGAGYGIIGLLDTGLSFLESLIGYIIHGGIVRFYHEEEGDRKNMVVSTGTILIWLASLIVLAIVFPLARPLSSLVLGDADAAVYMLLSVSGFLLQISGQAAGSVLIITRRSFLFSVLGILRLLLAISLNIYLIIIRDMGLMGFFLSSFITQATMSIIFHAISIRLCGFRFDRDIARKLIAFQLPLIPSNLFSFFGRQAERIILRSFLSVGAVGVLEMAYKFPTLLITLITTPFMRSWQTKRTEIAHLPEGRAEIGRMFSYFVFIMCFASLTMAANIDALIQLLTPEEFWEAGRIAKLLIISEILVGCNRYVLFGLFYAKKTKEMAIIRIAVHSLKILLSYLLIANMGMAGVGWASVICLTIQVGVTGWRSSRYYAYTIEYGRVITLMATAFALVVAILKADLIHVPVLARLAADGSPKLVDLMAGSWIGRWRDGVAVEIFTERSHLVFSLLYNTLASLLYVAIFPAVFGFTSPLRFLKRGAKPAPVPVDAEAAAPPKELP